VASLLTLALLWGFAFITGLSPSVVRAAIMFSLFTVARTFSQRDTLSINTLSAAALLMLICRPAWLYDVGFQLSFCSILAILYIHPVILRRFPSSKRRVVRGLFELISLSIAAQIGTLPLVLHYFSTFPLHFLLANLLVVPLTSLIMYASVGLIVFAPLPALQFAFAPAVIGLVRLLNAIVRWIEQLPYASLDLIGMDGWEVAALYLIIFLGMIIAFKHRARPMQILLAAILCLFVYRLTLPGQQSAAPQPAISFYAVRQCGVIQCCAANSDAWLIYPDSVPDRRRLLKAMRRHWSMQGMRNPVDVKPGYCSPALSLTDHLLVFADRRIAIVVDNELRNKSCARPLEVDYLYIGRGFKGEPADLLLLFPARQVVLDALCPAYRREQWRQACDANGVPCLSLHEKGFVDFQL
jgi:competence protein ComEC